VQAPSELLPKHSASDIWSPEGVLADLLANGVDTSGVVGHKLLFCQEFPGYVALSDQQFAGLSCTDFPPGSSAVVRIFKEDGTLEAVVIREKHGASALAVACL
jgi:hypothetical protein